MEDRKYKVSRDNVYVGEVVSTDFIYRSDLIYRYEGIPDKSGQLVPESWFPYRSMLFVPNEEKLSNDLLYRSPSYPILNVTDDDICLGVGENIVIKDACNLAALLEYFGYSECLTFEDIMRIRKTFFNGKFVKDNCELFGWINTRLGYEYSRGSESVLPSEYFDVLFDRGDNTFMDALQYHEKMNAFAPHKQEGPIKKLTKFIAV